MPVTININDSFLLTTFGSALGFALYCLVVFAVGLLLWLLASAWVKRRNVPTSKVLLVPMYAVVGAAVLAVWLSLGLGTKLAGASTQKPANDGGASAFGPTTVDLYIAPPTLPPTMADLAATCPGASSEFRQSGNVLKLARQCYETVKCAATVSLCSGLSGYAGSDPSCAAKIGQLSDDDRLSIATRADDAGCASHALFWLAGMTDTGRRDDRVAVAVVNDCNARRLDPDDPLIQQAGQLLGQSIACRR